MMESTKYYNKSPLLNIAKICLTHGVKNAILSPGSRCAPLVLAFETEKNISCYSVTDERSAAFIGLGIAEQTNAPVALICTSGTAPANYYPAIIEAFYKEIPLIVLTADRPPEWIDQQDGQCIRQQNMFGNHVKGFFQLPVTHELEDEKWHLERVVSDACNLANNEKKGPIQINIPIREPFYPATIDFKTDNLAPKVITEIPPKFTLSKSTKRLLKSKFDQYTKILIILGQNDLDQKTLSHLRRVQNLTIVSDITTNGHPLEGNIRHHDLWLSSEKKELQPELLITFGKSVISKNLKLFLRKNAPKEHLHIQEYGTVADTFQALTQILRCPPKEVLKLIPDQPTEYLHQWHQNDIKIAKALESFEYTPLSELYVVKKSLELLPKKAALHLANSMSVRYANFYNTLKSPQQTVYANRGASGIDGSISTAIGHAIANPERLHFLITGDLSFFYDRNAFWNQLVPDNFKVILLNNHGGVIFRMIPGPAKIPNFEKFFITKNKDTAERLSIEKGIHYTHISSKKKFDTQIQKWFKLKSTSILEIETDNELNKAVFFKLKEHLKK